MINVTANTTKLLPVNKTYRYRKRISYLCSRTGLSIRANFSSYDSFDPIQIELRAMSCNDLPGLS